MARVDRFRYFVQKDVTIGCYTSEVSNCVLGQHIYCIEPINLIIVNVNIYTLGSKLPEKRGNELTT